MLVVHSFECVSTWNLLAENVVLDADWSKLARATGLPSICDPCHSQQWPTLAKWSITMRLDPGVFMARMDDLVLSSVRLPILMVLLVIRMRTVPSTRESRQSAVVCLLREDMTALSRRRAPRWKRQIIGPYSMGIINICDPWTRGFLVVGD